MEGLQHGVKKTIQNLSGSCTHTASCKATSHEDTPHSFQDEQVLTCSVLYGAWLIFLLCCLIEAFRLLYLAGKAGVHMSTPDINVLKQIHAHLCERYEQLQCLDV